MDIVRMLFEPGMGARGLLTADGAAGVRIWEDGAGAAGVFMLEMTMATDTVAMGVKYVYPAWKSV